MLRKAVGLSDFQEKSIKMVYGSTLFGITRGWVGVKFPRKNVTLYLNGPKQWSLEILFLQQSLRLHVTG